MSDTSEPQLRRSKRVRKQAIYDEDAELEEGDNPSTSSSLGTSRARKTRNQSSAHEREQKPKAKRRKRGFLQRLKELPLDVVFEIFNHLIPHDLLNLSRTSKDLRKLLLSRSTISVWKSARLNVEGLPDIPDDMSEPAYAHLCFDVRCHHCENKHPAVNLLWHSRTRSCHGCLNHPFYFKEEVYRTWRSGADQEWRPRPQSYYLPIFADLWEIIRYRGDVRKDNRRTYYFYCSENERQQIVAELQANKDDPVWKQQKIAEGEAIAKHAQEMQVWWQGEAERHQLELEQKRKEREEEILQRLTDNGWEEELHKQRASNGLGFLYELGIATRAKKLTESDWNELEPKLEQALVQAKERRLIREQREKWTRRYRDFKELLEQELEGLPFNTLGPSVFDIANLDDFQQKLFAPIDHQITREHLVGLFERIPVIRAQWIQSREEDLVGLMKENGVADASKEMLHQAATIFVCTDCAALCSYPKPLVHRCSRIGGYYGFAFGNTPSFAQFLSTTGAKVWDVKQYRYDPGASNIAKAILSECGMSPESRVEDVKRTNIWLEGQDTRSPLMPMITGGRPLYTLCRAIYSPSRFGRRWIIPSEEDKARANSQATVSGSMIGVALCKHCETVVGSYGIVKHLQTEHGLTTFGPDDLTPSLEEDPWCLDFDVVRLQDEVPAPSSSSVPSDTTSTSGVPPIV